VPYLSGDDELKLENTNRCQINTFKPTVSDVNSVTAFFCLCLYTCGAIGVDVLDAALGTIRLLGKPENVIDLCEQVDLAAEKTVKD